MGRKIRTISHIIYRPLSSDEIRRLAVVRIFERSDGKKKEKEEGKVDIYNNTVYDPKLGTTDPYSVCATCNQKMQDCPGHYGYIEMTRPMYNPVYVSYVVALLNSVCHKCYRLLAEPKVNYKNLPKSEIFGTVTKDLKTYKACTRCGEERTNITIIESRPVASSVSRKGKKFQYHFKAEKARAILSQIPPEDLDKLGYFRNKWDGPAADQDYIMDPRRSTLFDVLPEDYLIETLIVPPPHCRPVVIAGSDRTDDDLTRSYNTIIGYNNDLRMITSTSTEPRPQTKKKIKTEAELIRLIYYEICNIYDSKKNPRNLKNTERQIQGIVQRDSKKDGRMQKSIASKRVNYTARAVIIPGGILIQLGEFGVPKCFAEKITIPVRVQSYNLEECERYVDHRANGPKAVIVERRGIRYHVGVLTEFYTKPFVVSRRGIEEEGLQIGDIIERPLQDGDIIIVNRQPTIRLESMQAMKVKLVDGNAFMLPVEECAGYNADYDGDEMNCHFIQTADGRLEAMMLMGVDQSIVSASTVSPIIAVVQNGLLMNYGCSMLWKTPSENSFSVKGEDGNTYYTSSALDRENVMDAYFTCEEEMENFADFCSRASKIYPSSFVKRGGVLTFAKKIDPRVYLSIAFPKNFSVTVKTGIHSAFPFVSVKRGIIQKKSGPLTKKVVGSSKGSFVHTLWCHPWSSLHALEFLRKMNKLMILWTRIVGFSLDIEGLIPENLGDVKEKREEMFQKCIAVSNNPFFGPAEKEERINNIIDSFSTIGGTFVKANVDERNEFNQMAGSGAKGSHHNLSLMMVQLGQQTVENKRVKKWLGTRTLPHCKPNDPHPRNQGYVESCFVHGLTPFEYIIHCACGRTGAIDTATKTGNAGHASKQMNTKARNIHQRPDGTVRDISGNIVQILYGDDWTNAKYLVQTPIGTFFTNPIILADAVCAEIENSGKVDLQKRKLSEQEIRIICQNISYDHVGDVSKSKPIRMLVDTLRRKLTLLLKQIEIYPIGILDFAQNIARAFYSSRNPDGHAIGQASAAALSQEQVQLTLNTHQLVGGKAEVTAGLPALLDLLHATQTGKWTSYIYFSDDVALELESLVEDPETNRDLYRLLSKRSKWFPYVILGDFIESVSIQYIPVKGKIPEASPVDFRPPRQFKIEWWNEEMANKGPWIIVLNINRSMSFKYEITLETLAQRIRDSTTETDFFVIASPEAQSQICIYCIRVDSYSANFVPSQNKAVNERNLSYFVNRDAVVQYLHGIYVSGVEGITKAAPYYNKFLKNWCIVTNGSNLRQVLTFPGVDIRRTTCSNMHEINEVFGIHAATRFIFNELVNVLTRNGSTMNHRNVSVIVDSMVTSGKILKIAEGGISVESDGPIAKVLFEKGTTHLINASALGLEDNCRSAQARIATGRPCLLGTGFVEIVTRN